MPVNALPAEVVRLLRDRLRCPPVMQKDLVVHRSLPTMFFGELSTARVATIGLYPSFNEYDINKGSDAPGRSTRLATLDSLAIPYRRAMTDEACDAALTRMCEYFTDVDARRTDYFAPLEQFLRGFGATYKSGAAVHLDLMHEAMRSNSEDVPQESIDKQFRADASTWMDLVARLPIEFVLCDGKTVGEHVCRALNVTALPGEAIDAGTSGAFTWWTGAARISGRGVRVAGWNYQLSRAPAFNNAARAADFGRIVRAAIA